MRFKEAVAVKTKYYAAILVAAIMINMILPFASLLIIDASASDSLGSITECVIDQTSEKIMIRGSIKHSVLVNNRDGKLAVYRFDPWVNVANAVRRATPLATMDMTIRFEFSLPCNTIANRLSIYVVAIIDSDGTVTTISEPQYADMSTSDTSGAGFKGVATGDVAASVIANPGSAIIDVYLDKLDKGNKSGYIFSADGELFYFDREVIKEIDKKVLSYTAAGADVYFRFLISPFENSLPFCTSGNLWSTNKCVVVSDPQALNALYAYTYFLMSRYDGGDFGKVDGIVLGRGADLPVLYNYASLVSEDYEEVYSRSLALVGLAAIEAAGEDDISLIVPVGDLLSENNTPHAIDFLNEVAAYISDRTELSFTVMCESRHNPYKLTDSMFSTEIIPDDTTEETSYDAPPETEIVEETTSTESTEEPETTEISEPETEDTAGEEASVAPEDTTAPEEKPTPKPNTNADGYFCTDNINVFLNMFNRLKKTYSSVNPGFAWCWYPDINTSEGSLGACYAYNYMRLAVIGADFYAVCFENDVADKFSSLSHIFKYIDTSKNIKETAYACSLFGCKDWSDIISGFSEGAGIFSNLYEGELEPNVADYTGSITYFDYSAGRGSGGWFDGLYCKSLGLQSVGGETCLQADMDLEASGVNHAEIGYLFDEPEPLLLGDALTFDIKCGEEDGSLYEVAVYLCCGDDTIVSKTVVAGGVRIALSLNVSKIENTVGVESMKIMLKRVTGSGGCKLDLYRVVVNSSTVSDNELMKDLQELRDYLRPEQESSDSAGTRRVIFGIIILTAIGVVALSVSYGNDRRRGAEDENQEMKKQR